MNKIERKLFLIQLPYIILFFIALVIIGYLYGFIEVAFLFLGFVILRYSYNNKITYHKYGTLDCIIFSIKVFIIAGIPLLSISLGISIFAPIIISIGITWWAHEKQKSINIERKLNKLLYEKKESFDINNCTEEQLRIRIAEKYPKLKGDKLEYKVFRGLQHFVYKKEHKEIDINPRQSEKERERMKKILK